MRGAVMLDELASFDVMQSEALTLELVVRPMGVELCGKEPMSVRVLVDELGGSQYSGCQRKQIGAEIEAALLSFYDVARETEGTDEGAAILLLRMVARDPVFDAPPWLRELFAAHREALEETFYRPDHGREDDYSSEGDRW
jgi:hypothetical protein